MKKTFVNKGALRDGVRLAAVAGPWESASDLFKFVIEQQRCKDVSFWDFLRQYRKEEAELQTLRDEALATRGSGKQGYVPPEVNCPARHGPKPFVAWDDGFCCSLCEGVIPQGSQCLGCRLCDHDVCTDCIRKLWPEFEIAGEVAEPDAAAGTRRRRRRGKAAAKAGAAGAEQAGAVAIEEGAGGSVVAEPAPVAEPSAVELEATRAVEAETELGAQGHSPEESPDQPEHAPPAVPEAVACVAKPEVGADVGTLAEATLVPEPAPPAVPESVACAAQPEAGAEAGTPA